MSKKIIPLNLPAGLEREIDGNPVTTRLETVPANCFPGLDIDARNLDRRFFPGLLFDFPSLKSNDHKVKRTGALLVNADPGDPDLKDDQVDLKKQLKVLAKMLSSTRPRQLPKTLIFLDSITDEEGDTVLLAGSNKAPLDGPLAWRIVRSLVPGKITIGLSELVNDELVSLMKLEGYRRTYRKETGELSDVYAPGELTQSLCSPWQHDFLGCSCTYWASNHPDIVLASHPADIAEVDDPGKTQDRAQDPILWMRWNLDEPVAPLADGSISLEMDGYEINSRWRELAFVLEGREQPAPWRRARAIHAPPMSVSEIVPRLQKLAGVELAVALEYLYARYTVPFYEELNSQVSSSARFIAHELLKIAIEEMSHLRWVNELLSKMRTLTVLRAEPAVLSPGFRVPCGTWSHDEGRTPVYKVKWRAAKERNIRQAIDDFLAAEAPSGTLEGQYAQILSTLKNQDLWPKKRIHKDLVVLVERIISDGVDHYSRFREIKELLNGPNGKSLVKPLTLIQKEKDKDDYQEASSHYRGIVDELQKAYKETEEESLRTMDAAVEQMKKFDVFAKTLATRNLAIPLLAIGREVEKPASPLLPGGKTKRPLKGSV